MVPRVAGLNPASGFPGCWRAAKVKEKCGRCEETGLAKVRQPARDHHPGFWQLGGRGIHSTSVILFQEAAASQCSGPAASTGGRVEGQLLGCCFFSLGQWGWLPKGSFLPRGRGRAFVLLHAIAQWWGSTAPEVLAIIIRRRNVHCFARKCSLVL